MAVETFSDGVIEWNYEDNTATITSPKRNEKIIVWKKFGKYNSYAVRYESGKTVSEIGDGQFLSLHSAVEAVKAFLSVTKQSQAAKSEELARLRKERNDAKNKP